MLVRMIDVKFAGLSNAVAPARVPSVTAFDPGLAIGRLGRRRQHGARGRREKYDAFRVVNRIANWNFQCRWVYGPLHRLPLQPVKWGTGSARKYGTRL